MQRLRKFVVAACIAAPVRAHVAAWHDGMYCRNGTSGVDNPNTNDIVVPLYNLTRSDWWMHHVNGCDLQPPGEGVFLEIPAGGTFTVEFATNRAFTTLSYGGVHTGTYIDNIDLPSVVVNNPEACVSHPNIHTTNESEAAGTAFAISYTSNLSDVTPENLVVFSVLYNTPWRRLATYSVPNLPACPDSKGCICAWGWVPKGCGTANMYMEPFRCLVTGTMGSVAVANATAAMWCEGDQAKCVQGAKQMIYWHQLDGNNIDVSGNDLEGFPKSPAYNGKLGFANGSQNDIFLVPGTATATIMGPHATKTAHTSSGTRPTVQWVWTVMQTAMRLSVWLWFCL